MDSAREAITSTASFRARSVRSAEICAEVLQDDTREITDGENDPKSIRDMFHHLDRLFLIREVMQLTTNIAFATMSPEARDKIENKIDGISLPKTIFQRKEDGSPIMTCDELLGQATDALKCYEKIMWGQIDTMDGVEVHVGPLKAADRIIAKAVDKYGGKMSAVNDVVRAKALCKNGKSLMKVYDKLMELQEQRVLSVVKLKNRFREPTVAGYRDMNTVLQLHGDGKEHLCELQLGLIPLNETTEKHDSHEEYEYFRKKFVGSWESTMKHLDQMENLHNKGLGGTLDRVMEKVNTIFDGSNTDGRNGHLFLLKKFGVLLGKFNAYQLQLKVFKRYLDVTHNLADKNNKGAPTPDHAIAHTMLFQIYSKIKIYPNALEHAELAYETNNRLYSDHGQEGYKFTIETQSNYGWALYKLGRYTKAESMLQQSYTKQQQVKGEHHWRTALIEEHLGRLYTDMQRFNEAKDMLEHSMEVKFNDVGTKEDLEYIHRLYALSEVYWQLDEVHDNLRLAEAKAREAILLYEKVQGRGSSQVQIWYEDLRLRMAQLNKSAIEDMAKSRPRTLVRCIDQVLKGEQMVQLLEAMQSSEPSKDEEELKPPLNMTKTKKGRSGLMMRRTSSNAVKGGKKAPPSPLLAPVDEEDKKPKIGKRRSMLMVLGRKGHKSKKKSQRPFDAGVSVYIPQSNAQTGTWMEQARFKPDESDGRREIHDDICRVLFAHHRSKVGLSHAMYRTIPGTAMANYDEKAGHQIGSDGTVFMIVMHGIFAVRIGNPPIVYSQTGGNTKLPDRTDGPVRGDGPDGVSLSCIDAVHGGIWTDLGPFPPNITDTELKALLEEAVQFARHPGMTGKQKSPPPNGAEDATPRPQPHHQRTNPVQTHNLMEVLTEHLHEIKKGTCSIFAGFGGNLRMGMRVYTAQAALERPEVACQIEDKFQRDGEWFENTGYYGAWARFKAMGPGIAFVMDPLTGREEKVAVGRHTKHFDDDNLGEYMMSIEFEGVGTSGDDIATYRKALEEKKPKIRSGQGRRQTSDIGKRSSASHTPASRYARQVAKRAGEPNRKKGDKDVMQEETEDMLASMPTIALDTSDDGTIIESAPQKS